MKKFILTKIIIIVLVLLPAVLFAQQKPPKYALVIGNGDYTGPGISRLANPVNDANDMAAALRDLGFTVDKVLNGSLDQMEKAIANLKTQLQKASNSYGFLFYAGHGVQAGGENYLIPVDANIPNEAALRIRALSVQIMLEDLNDANNDLNVVILDACRDNPFGWNRSGSRGLGQVSSQPAGSVIVYATSAGKTASDGAGRNGLFTGQLLKNIKTPGLEISEILRRTGADVYEVSNRQQIPAIYNQYFGIAYLGEAPNGGAAVQPSAPPAAGQTSVNSINGFVRINGGTFTMGNPDNEPDRYDNEGPQRQVTVSSFYIGKYEVTQKEYREVMGTNPSNFTGDDLPVENVNWFDAIQYCNRRSRLEGLTPAYTIIDETKITWNRRANGYRLPTEAEWEYACRAGTTTPFSTGNNITTNQANYAGTSPYNNNARGEYRQKTTPVGSFTPNDWGLYDMHGNVLEWCWDLYERYSNKEETDPEGPSSGMRRVLRGGAWNSVGRQTRSAYRWYYTPTARNSNYGFRLVRS